MLAKEATDSLKQGLYFNSLYVPHSWDHHILLPFDLIFFNIAFRGFPGGPLVKNLPSKAQDVDLIPGWVQFS